MDVAEEFIVHLVGSEGGCEGCADCCHVVEEGLPVLVCQLVQFFLVPFQREESVSLEQLVGVELGDAGPGLVVYQVRGGVEVLAYPAVFA